MHPLIEIYQSYGSKDETVVSSDLVCRIFSIVSFSPARTSAYIAKVLGIDPKTVEWHSRKLVDANIVSLNSERNRYFLRGTVQENELEYFNALYFQTSVKIMSYLLEKEEIAVGKLDMNKITVNKKIKLLENVGFVNETRRGKEVYVSIGDNLLRFRDLMKGRANLFITNYLRRLKLSKIDFKILNVTEYSTSIVTNYGIPIIFSRDPILTVIMYG